MSISSQIGNDFQALAWMKAGLPRCVQKSSLTGVVFINLGGDEPSEWHLPVFCEWKLMRDSECILSYDMCFEAFENDTELPPEAADVLCGLNWVGVEGSDNGDFPVFHFSDGTQLMLFPDDGESYAVDMNGLFFVFDRSSHS